MSTKNLSQQDSGNIEAKSVSRVPKEINSALKLAYEKCCNLIGEKDAIRELGFATQIVSKTPALMKCSVNSIIDAITNASRAKITLNPSLRLAYLIPRKNTAVLDISYMGLITILKKSGGCKYIEAFIVYKDEAFNYNPSDGSLQHTVYYATTEAEQKQRKIIGCYSRAVLLTNDVVFCFMPYWEIEKVKKFSEGSESKWSAWQNWEEEMIKKSVIKRHFKNLVSGNEMAEVLEALKIEEDNYPLKKDVSQSNKTNLFNISWDEEDDMNEDAETQNLL